MIASMRAFMEAALAGSSKPVHFKETASGLRAYKAKSIAYSKCSEAEFKKILDKAVEIIETVVGVPIETLKRESAREV